MQDYHSVDNFNPDYDLPASIKHNVNPFRLIYLDGTSLINNSPSALESIILNTSVGQHLQEQCDKEMLTTAKSTDSMFVHKCHTGLRKYVMPLFLNGYKFGIAVNGGLRPHLHNKYLQELAERCSLPLEQLRIAAQPIPFTSPNTRSAARSLLTVMADTFRMRAQFNMEHEFLVQALGQPDLDSLLKFTVTRSPLVTQGNFCSIFLWDEEKNKFILRESNNPSINRMKGHVGYNLGDGLTGWVGKFGIPIQVQNVKDSQELEKYGDTTCDRPVPVWSGKATEFSRVSEGYASHLMIVPISAQPGSSPIGIIRLVPTSKDSPPPSKKTLDFFSHFGNLIYKAVQTTELNDCIRQLAIAVTEDDVDQCLNVLLSQICQVMEAHTAYIQVQDPIRLAWHTVSSQGRFEYTCNRAIIDDDVWPHSCKYYLENEFYLDLEIARNSSLQETLQRNDISPEYKSFLNNITSFLAVSLTPERISRGNNPAVLYVCLKNKASFQQSSVRFLSNLRPVLSSVVGKLQQYQMTKGGVKAFEELSNRTKEQFSREEIVQALLKEVLHEVKADLVLFRRVDKEAGTLILEAYEPMESSYPGTIPLHYYMGERGSGKAAERKKTFYNPNTEIDPLLVENDYAIDGAIQKFAKGTVQPRSSSEKDFLLWIKSEIAVPMVVADHLVGVLIVIGSRPYQFKWRNVAFLESLAHLAGLVLRCAELVEEQSSAKYTLWKVVSAQATHKVGNRIESLVYFLEALRKSLEEDYDVREIVNEDIPQLRASLTDAKSFLRQFRRFSLSQTLTLTPLSLLNLLQNTIAEFGAPEFKITLNWDSSIGEINGDGRELKLSFHEILQNALESGATTALINCEMHERSNCVHIRICNNGNPIPLTHSANIFEVMYTSKPTGTGLGLAMVKEVIEGHGGTISLDTNMAERTCFLIKLPTGSPVKHRE